MEQLDSWLKKNRRGRAETNAMALRERNSNEEQFAAENPIQIVLQMGQAEVLATRPEPIRSTVATAMRSDPMRSTNSQSY